MLCVREFRATSETFGLQREGRLRQHRRVGIRRQLSYGHLPVLVAEQGFKILNPCNGFSLRSLHFCGEMGVQFCPPDQKGERRMPLMPIAWQARKIRSAISPRFAMTILSNAAIAMTQRMTNKGSSNSTGWPFSTRTATTVPEISASIWLNIFMASMMHMVSPSLICCPRDTNASASGLEES